MGCQSAVQLGPQAAETVLRRLEGEEPVPVSVGFAGQCISLGRRFGVFQVSQKDDTANRYYLGGRPGGKLKEFICRSTVWQLRYEARKPGAHTWWAKDDKRQELLLAKRGEVPSTVEPVS
jgi:NADH dehydrogenase FAD-containing subunit